MKKTSLLLPLVTILSFVLFAPPSSANDKKLSDSVMKIVKRWAPVIYQDVAKPMPRADYITNVDFDGDFISNNNWDNFDKNFPLKAYVYYHVVETKTHLIVGYDVFHPRDWEDVCPENAYTCHENDFEGSYAVVEKDGKDGELKLFATMAHDFYTYFINEKDLAKFQNEKDIVINGTIQYVDGHPVILVESRGHGQYGGAMKRSLKALAAALSSNAPRKLWSEKGFPEGDGVIYKYKDGKAEEPDASKQTQETGYGLINFETLYAMRNNIGPGKLFAMDGKMEGNNYGANAANMPWNWNKDYFFDPAKGFEKYLKVLGEYSTNYLYNPFN